MENISEENCSVRISAGARKTGGGNSAATIPVPTRFCSIAGWIAQASRNAPWNMFCFTKCCTSSIPLAVQVAVWSPIRKNFAPRKSASPNLNGLAGPSTASHVNLRPEIKRSRRRRSRVLRRNDCRCGRGTRRGRQTPGLILVLLCSLMEFVDSLLYFLPIFRVGIQIQIPLIGLYGLLLQALLFLR